MFSLYEIEHGLLRGAMSRPRVGPLRIFMPSIADDPKYRHALRRAEPAVNFLLNSGNVTSLRAVPVLEGGRAAVRARVTRACAALLRVALGVDAARGVVTLPKICDWYLNDFGDGRGGGGGGGGGGRAEACARFAAIALAQDGDAAGARKYAALVGLAPWLVPGLAQRRAALERPAGGGGAGGRKRKVAYKFQGYDWHAHLFFEEMPMQLDC